MSNVRPRRWRGCTLKLALGLMVLLVLGYFGISIYIIEALTVPKRKTSADTPESVAGVAFERVTIPSRDDKAQLASWFLPSDEREQAVIFVHGISSSRMMEFQGQAPKFIAGLRQRGYTVLAIDMRGHGESSDGHFTFGLEERRDVQGAVDWLLERGYAPGSIGVVGVSMGAATSIGATAEEPAIGALVVDSPFAEVMPILEQEFTKNSGLPTWFLPGSVLMGQMLLGQDLSDAKPVEEIDDIKAPVLLIHATGDDLIPVAHAERIAAANPSIELWITDGENHVTTYAEQPEAYLDRVADFFDANLK